MRFPSRRGAASVALVSVLALLALLVPAGADPGAGPAAVVSKPFAGVKVNGGTVMVGKRGSQTVLTLSDDFQVPDTPAPHWQIVDRDGNAHLFNRLMIKDNVYNRTLRVPAFVNGVARVQIWCAFAETLLGEAAFEKTVE